MCQEVCTDLLVGPARWFLNMCNGDVLLASQMIEFASKLTYYKRRKALDKAVSEGRGSVWRPGDEAVATSTMEGRNYGDISVVAEVLELDNQTTMLTLVGGQRVDSTRFAKVKRSKKLKGAK